jgi:soluble lytic murein transglycosylase
MQNSCERWRKTIRTRSEENIPVRWHELAPALLLAAALAAPPPAADFEALARRRRAQPTAENHAALIRYADAHPDDTSGALALLALAYEDLLAKRPVEAANRLHGAAQRLTAISDYVAYLRALAQFDLSDDAGALQSAETVFTSRLPSPLAGQAAILSARAWMRAGQPQEAVAVLQRHYDALAQPDGDLALARAFEAAQDLVSAAACYQRVYYRRPLAPGAGAAGEALARLKLALGAAYPAPSPQSMLERATELLEGGEYALAQRELESLAPLLSSPDRDLALVEAGVARYRLRQDLTATSYFQSLRLSSADADAQRLYYLVECARRLKNPDILRTALDQLAKRYPASDWRLRAIIAAANYYLLQNDAASYVPLFQACYQSFPNADQAAACHWKVAFAQYLQDRAAAAEQFEQHLRQYPRSEKTPAALYFLGRIDETNSNWGAARACYEEITHRFPNSYYSVVARSRLRDPVIGRSQPPASAQEFLASLRFPRTTLRADFNPDQTTKPRLERARLLSSAALDEYAEIELKYAAEIGRQPQVIALELARCAWRAGAPERGIRYMKRYAPGYLSLPLESAPQEFWRLAFPLPYRAAVETYSRANDLDPCLLAALIRQESEFDPKAISRARAYGLTQVLPGTGRLLSRRAGLPYFKPELLFQPEVNIRLGAFYIKSLILQFDGSVETALAAYNAGKNRAALWRTWGEFREPAEFVEVIPYSETRNYVQTVLRNADIYRRLYTQAPQFPFKSIHPDSAVLHP